MAHLSVSYQPRVNTIDQLLPTVATSNLQLKIATFNLFNYLTPPNAFYEFERIYSAEQWQKKQNWICDYLTEHQPDIIGFQEVFSPNSLQELVNTQGYEHFAVVDAPEVIDDFIYRSPVVAIASRYLIVEVTAVEPDITMAQTLGLTDNFAFSRKVIRATVDVPHLGKCDCYVVHFKSKRSMIEFGGIEIDEKHSDTSTEKGTIEKSIIESLKAQVAGTWGSTIQRGSEATLLMVNMIERREATGNPMVLMGDFNNTLQDGVLNHLLTNSLRFVSPFDQQAYLAKYTLNDAWNLFANVITNEIPDGEDEGESNACDSEINTAINAEAAEAQSSETETLQRAPTHYFNGKGSVLDYILLSCEFDASYHDSL